MPTPRAVAFVAVLLLAVSFAAPSALGATSRTAAPLPSSLVPARSTAARPVPTPPEPSTSASPGLERWRAVEAGLRAKGLDPAGLHLPNFAAEKVRPDQPVSPLYTNAPAPMGVADIGLRNVSGQLTPYALNSTSVAGTVSITNLTSLYVDGDGPDSYGIQLNSVANGVTIFGNSSFEFWSQNYATYTVSTDQLVLGDEVWNFSSFSGNFPANGIYAYSPDGNLSFLPYLYQGYGPTITVGYPFSLTLFLNSSIFEDRPVLYFNYSVTNATFSESGSFDYLVFNSSVGAPTGPAPTAYYQADGYSYDPIGLINDMEIDVLGNDDGDTTLFYEANATISLQYWNATLGRLVEVPSAFNAGQETGETSNGLSVTSSGGADPHGVIRSGPSFLGGLWNYSAYTAVAPVTIHLRPAEAFLFINQGPRLEADDSQWVPTNPNGTTTIDLPFNGSFYFEFLFSEYAPQGFPVAVGGPETFLVHLLHDETDGVYTPLIAIGNAEVANLSVAGNGTPANPYELESNEYGPIAPEFTTWDDYLFPLFPGLLLAGTNVWVVATPPPFDVQYSAAQLTEGLADGLGLPASNQLQLQLYDASNVTLTGAASIGGWLSVYEGGFAESSLVLWNCSNDLIAANTFADEGVALGLFGGTNNTVWGNTFETAAPLTTSPGSLMNSGPALTGINETESGDLLYNNYLSVALPSVTPTVNPFTCDQFGECPAVAYSDTWNVTPQPASDGTIVHGLNLTGSILGVGPQGGNYWSNYGTQTAPFGVLPYTDGGAITVGGDYAPLLPFALFPVTVGETGLPAGDLWNVSADGVATASNGSSIGIALPNGTYPLTVGAPAGYVGSGPAALSVDGAPVGVEVVFRTLANLTFQPAGLADGALWEVSVSGSGLPAENGTGVGPATTVTFTLPVGPYNYTASAAGYDAEPPNGSVTLPAGGLVTPVTFAPISGTIALRVSPASASVYIDGRPVVIPGGNLTTNATPGLHALEVGAPGYATAFDNVSVVSGRTTYVNITLQVIGPTGTSTATGLSGEAEVIIAILLVGFVLAALLLVYYATREGPPPPPRPGGPV